MVSSKEEFRIENEDDFEKVIEYAIETEYSVCKLI